MASDYEKHESFVPPPMLDEGYWSSLLNDEGNDSDHSLGENFDTIAFDESLTDVSFDDVGGTGDINDWLLIQQIADRDEAIDLLVIGYNRGGLLVEWRSLRGFVPASQLLNFPTNSPFILRRKALMDQVGCTLKLRVIELSAEQNRFILSERAAQVQPGDRARILIDLKPGDIVEGTVTNICDFGIFVDLGGLEGLIHISELSWGRVGHPEQILKRGEIVRAYVLDLNRDKERIALSIKRLNPDPWQTVDQRYKVGQIIQATITNVVDFGAFARIENGLEGLIHVSELAEGTFLHPRNVVTEGQVITASILSIDGKSRRLGLSLRLIPPVTDD